MAIIKNVDQLKPLIPAIKDIQKMQSDDGDWLDKFDRILTGINSLMDKAKSMNTGQSMENDTSRFGRATMSNDSIGKPALIAERATPASPVNNEKDNNKMQFQKQLINVLSDHINKCVKENPNMSIGEAILHFPMTVTQIAVLFELFKQKGG
jgi:hypothetical protein